MTDQTVQKIEEYTHGLLERLGCEQFQLAVDEDDEYLHIDIHLPESESGILIGHHGETLDALRRIIRTSFIP